jgi:hypothetical protein
VEKNEAVAFCFAILTTGKGAEKKVIFWERSIL